MGILDGILDQLMPGPSKNPYQGLLSDDAYRQHRGQQFMRGLGSVGNDFMRIATGGGPGPMPAGGQAGLLNKMRLEKAGLERAEKQNRASRYSELVGGRDPKTGIDWKTERQGPGHAGLLGLAQNQNTNPALLQGLLQAMGPEAGTGLLAKQAFAKPAERFETAENPYGRGGVGQRSTTTGRIAGYQKPDNSGAEPAAAQLARIYQGALKAEGKSIPLAEALRWARTSVERGPREVWMGAYTANLRNFEDDEAARRIADSVVRHVTNFQVGGGQQPPIPGQTGLSPAGSAQAAVPPVGGPGIPRRRPSLEGVKFPLPPDRTPPSGGRISAMSLNEITDLVYNGDRELTEAEKLAIDRRLKQLGHP